MRELTVWRVHDSTVTRIGTITNDPILFAYDAHYLASHNSQQISYSLPLREEAYSEVEIMPYFNGLLPEGEARVRVAEALSTDPRDFLELLHRCGMEIIGDIAITEYEKPFSSGEYAPIKKGDMVAMFKDAPSIAQTTNASRLSLAGTQSKAGLTHKPNAPMDEDWFQPLGGYASTHVLKISSLHDLPYLEFICMQGAKACGIQVPETALLNLGRPVFCIERFDREVTTSDGSLQVRRLHQEDMAQALGIFPHEKYLEVQPNTASVIAAFLRDNSKDPIADIEEFAKITCYNYFIGNCDNHLKNLSLLYGSDWTGFRLAPAYDLVSTTRYERFSRDMGMNIGKHRTIDEITQDDFYQFAEMLKIHRDVLREICRTIVEVGHKTFFDIDKQFPGFDELSVVADNLLEELALREHLLRQIAGM